MGAAYAAPFLLTAKKSLNIYNTIHPCKMPALEAGN
jgi:hypothetical protein